MSTRWIGIPGLALVYALTLASFDPLDVLLGLVLGAVLMAQPRQPGEPIEGGGPALLVRVAWFPVFVAATIADVAAGTWDVALRVIHVRPVKRPGIVMVPFGDRTPQGVAVSALTLTLSPGSLLIDVDQARECMLLHVIDGRDPDEVRARAQRFYERYQRRVFP